MHRSFWLEQTLATEAQVKPSEQLNENHETDIVIIGGGYVGLWTAIQIKKLSPEKRVCLIEKDICGGGASGRNGGFVLSWWPKISSLVQLCGAEKALMMAKDSEQAIQDISQFCIENTIDAQFRKTGWLWTATSRVQLGAWNSLVDLCGRLEVEVFQQLSSEEVARRTGSAAHLQGIFDKTAAYVQPANLVRGLRRVALKSAVQIFENTEMLSFSRDNPIIVKTINGRIKCKKLVIANSAWAASISELANSIVAITSDMIMTEPCESELKQIGWQGGEGITDSQIMVDYYQVTKGHRIAFGKGGWGIAYKGNLNQDFDRNKQRAQMVEADFRRYYPQLDKIKISHDWCGPIDRTPNSLPLLGRFKKNKNIIYGVGWSGNGVGPSYIGGKVLASLALDKKDKWGEYPLVGKSAGKFPPEPIRYIGAHMVRAAVASKENSEMQDQKPAFWAEQLSKLAPAGLEDKE